VVLHFKVQSLLYKPPNLTFKISAFRPIIVFLCFVWIPEQTTIISLYSINWLVYKAETLVFTAQYRLDI